jgi:hypothetical protein
MATLRMCQREEIGLQARLFLNQARLDNGFEW